METIGERIRDLREARRKTPMELAYESKVSEATIRRYEAGDLPDAVAKLERIAAALGVPLSSLVIHDEIESATASDSHGSSEATRTSSPQTKPARPLAARR
jgi:transcriptional regulator with XRE-family HTH domain